MVFPNPSGVQVSGDYPPVKWWSCNWVQGGGNRDRDPTSFDGQLACVDRFGSLLELLGDERRYLSDGATPSCL